MWYNALMNYEAFYNATPKYTHAPGLSVMRELMSRLGDPQRELRCIHIAGTNGKGSCAAMTASVLQEAGFRTGLFTSPDLVDMRERIQINSVYITEADFSDVTQRVQLADEGLEPSYFEKLTAAAFLYFAEQSCDYVVLETGLGGRLDATNIIESTIASVIMPIGFDHMAVLGDTLAAIAGEKAGILKTGCPVVCAPQEPEALTVLRETAETQGCPFCLVDITKIKLLSHSPLGQRFTYGTWEDICLPLLGAHQLRNAAAVIEIARLMGIDEVTTRRGLARATWHCRLEYFLGTPPILLDGAHNAHGAEALTRALADYFPGENFTMVMGVMADKDYLSLLRLTEPFAARYICLAPDSPRALPAQELAALVHGVPAMTAENPAQALAMARQYSEPVCAFGSLYYIGHLRRCITET